VGAAVDDVSSLTELNAFIPLANYRKWRSKHSYSRGSGAILKAANFFTPQKKSQAAEISAHAPL